MDNPHCPTCRNRRRKCKAAYRWDKRTKSHTQVCDAYRVSLIATFIEWVKWARSEVARQQ